MWSFCSLNCYLILLRVLHRGQSFDHCETPPKQGKHQFSILERSKNAKNCNFDGFALQNAVFGLVVHPDPSKRYGF